MAKAKIPSKNKKKSSNPVGRPNWTPTPEILAEIEEMGSLGMTSQQIADALGFSVTTLCNKQNEYVEFLEAIRRGKARGIQFVASKLKENVKNSNVTAQIFYLKCQAQWRDQEIKDDSESFKEALEEIKAITKKCIKPL